MCVLFRNNGKYAFAFTILVTLIILLSKIVKKSNPDNKDKKKKEVKKYATILVMIMASLIVSTLALTIISKSLNAVQGDRREMLSVPIQQLARTYVYHAGAGVKSEDDNTMDEASKALINEFLLYDSAKLYRQDISDLPKCISDFLQNIPEIFSMHSLHKTRAFWISETNRMRMSTILMK